jgi:hypothetical protein
MTQKDKIEQIMALAMAETDFPPYNPNNKKLKPIHVRYATAAYDAITAMGYSVVPDNANDKQIKAGGLSLFCQREIDDAVHVGLIYRAMIAAAKE